MKKVVIQIGTMEWSGRTRREAEADRDQDLARLFASYSGPPTLVCRKGAVRAVVWQEHTGYYSYALVRPPEAKLGCCSSCQWSKAEAENRARRHLAQTIYDEEGPEASLQVLNHDDEEGLREHQCWLKYQAEYVAANGRPLTASNLTAERASTT